MTFRVSVEDGLKPPGSLLLTVIRGSRLGKRKLICLLSFTFNYVISVRRGSLPLGAWDGLRYFIVALPGNSI